ncbi:hypothetical protein [Streptomyces hygroscopicus]|uniref:SbtR family transcriptional regulator n=1 Tax=Streptomyces hygroscopicus TaxID=1912 RepID=UPI003A0FE2EC
MPCRTGTRPAPHSEPRPLRPRRRSRNRFPPSRPSPTPTTSTRPQAQRRPRADEPGGRALAVCRSGGVKDPERYRWDHPRVCSKRCHEAGADGSLRRDQGHRRGVLVLAPHKPSRHTGRGERDLDHAVVRQHAAALAAEGDPTALLTFFADVVERAAGARTVVHLLAAGGTDVGVERQVAGLEEALEALLARAQETGAVRADVRLDEVVALLTAACHGALAAGWAPEPRRRTVARLLGGLRP